MAPAAIPLARIVAQNITSSVSCVGPTPFYIDAAPGIIESSFDHIDEQRAGRDYLAGDEFSVADLTAAAIIGPLLRPPELQYPPAGTLPEPVEALRERLTKHPTWEWLRQIWQRHRSPSAEIR